MKKILTLIFLWLNAGLINAQMMQPFYPNSLPQMRLTDARVQKFESFSFNKEIFETQRSAIPLLANTGQLYASTARITLPLANGRTEHFFIAEISVLSQETALLYPEIKNYDLLSIDGSIRGRVTYSPLGFNAMLLTPDGTQYIAPASLHDASNHIVYFKKDYRAEGEQIKCGVEDAAMSALPKMKTTTALGDAMLRTYNFAVAATGEFTTFFGSQANAVASITATVSNINLIYERDLGIHLTLVTNNSVIFPNAATDPYATVSFPDMMVLDDNTATLDANIGASNYDLGMVFSDGWNGGLAYTPGVCNSLTKGGSAAGLAGGPAGPVMEGMVAHEVGHLFSANHTMSAGTGPACLDNLNLPTAYEIGGGSTIMAYAGAVCAGMAYQAFSDPYFHFNSVSVIRTYAQSLTTCGTATATSNTAPTLTVPASSYTIPVGTPFELTAIGEDADPVTSLMGPSKKLTYTFEQYDAAAAPMTSPPSSSSTSGPAFRSYPPSSSNTRAFPSIYYLVNNVLPSNWELPPQATRTMNFRALVRDNNPGNGAVAQESITVNTNTAAGPFYITSQNTASSYTANGTNTMTINWSVAGTDLLPVNTPNVDIFFSTDNGQTFPHLLAANVSNNGSAVVTVPNVNTNIGRIKVKGAGNIFFDINGEPITITSSCTANGATFGADTNVSSFVGNPLLNLSLSPNYGTPLSISGTLSSTDPTSTLAVVNGSGSSCVNFSNQFNYDLYTFQVNVSGSYTLTASGSTPFGTVFNLYENSFSVSNPCSNFMTSNGTFNGTQVLLGTTVTATLNAGMTYVLAVGTFSSAQPTLPASYSISASGPVGGNIYSGSPDPGSSFDYLYVVVNASGNIVEITATPDLSNTGLYSTTAAYTVYGLSVNNAVTPATLNGYVGGSFSTLKTALLNSTICGNLSGNSITVSMVDLLSLENIHLTASLSEAKSRLVWNVTGTEETQNYQVEKSADGRSYTIIGKVPAAQKGAYQFYDQTPYTGANYYRIKVVENDGRALYSNVARVNYQNFSFGEAQVFPNPATGKTTVRLPKQGVYQCVLTDVSGQIIRTFESGTAEFSLDMTAFAPGVYFLHCSSENARIVSRIVKQ